MKKIEKGQFLKYTTRTNNVLITLVEDIDKYDGKYTGVVVLSDSSHRPVGHRSNSWRIDVENMENEGLKIEIIEIEENGN